MTARSRAASCPLSSPTWASAEAELYRACSSHWLTANPLPDVDAWRAIERPQDRLAHALDELYAYYERSESMLANVFRDLDLVDALQPTVTPLQDFLAEGAATLTVGWNSRGRRRHLLRAALRHVVDFHTWRSLTADEQLTRAEAVGLAAALVQAAATPSASRSTPRSSP